VEQLKPAKVRREIADEMSVGLRLILQPSGAKSWAMRFRKPNGKPTKLTLGTFNPGRPASGAPAIGGPLTLSGARALAADINRQRAIGRDVVSQTMAEKERIRAEAQGRGDSFADVAREFIEKHKVRKTGQRPRNWREVARLLGLKYADEKSEPEIIKGGLAERWRDKPIGQITGHDAHAVVQESIKDGVPGTISNNPEPSDNRGRHLSNALGALFKWALRHRRAAMTLNPMAGVYRPAPPPPRARVLSHREIQLLWRALDDPSVAYPYPQITRLLLLTGCRLNEIARLELGDLDAERTRIDLPGARTKNGLPHIVPLAPLARDIVKDAKPVLGSPFVFTAGRKATTGWSSAKKNIDAAIAKLNGSQPITGWRIHDLRRSTATGMAEDLNVAPHIVEAALNHVSGAKAGVAGIYNRALHLDERKAALERWAVHVDGIVSGKPGKVVPMKRVRDHG
jgi:integrase